MAKKQKSKKPGKYFRTSVTPAAPRLSPALTLPEQELMDGTGTQGEGGVLWAGGSGGSGDVRGLEGMAGGSGEMVGGSGEMAGGSGDARGLGDLLQRGMLVQSPGEGHRGCSLPP